MDGTYYMTEYVDEQGTLERRVWPSITAVKKYHATKPGDLVDVFGPMTYNARLSKTGNIPKKTTQPD